MNSHQHKALRQRLESLSPKEGLRLLSSEFADKITFSTSFGQEDQAISHMIFSEDLPIKVFTLDTGRLFQETYEVWDRTLIKYGKPIEAWFPEQEAVQALVINKGPNSFYESVENRKECCSIRKVQPLRKALAGNTVWITGLRSDQSGARSDLPIWQFDEGFGIWKYNPLVHWDLGKVQEFLRTYRIPFNRLHDRGFVSIGCAPCTRAIQPDEDIRAGRWWWEQSHKECGLHVSTVSQQSNNHS